MRKGYPSKLRRSVVGYASAGFAEAVKTPRAKARGASPLEIDILSQIKQRRLPDGVVLLQ